MTRILLLLTVFSISCNPVKDHWLKTGIWRTVLYTENKQEIPFNFEVKTDSAGKPLIYIINGEERIAVNEIYTDNDSFRMVMPLFDSEFKGRFIDNRIEGEWIKHLAAEDVKMSFVAEPDKAYRFFDTNTEPAYDVTGRWRTIFLTEENDTTLAVGEFAQKGNYLTGTFLTSTGDYRFLEGTVQGANFYLSCFDGSHAYLFTGTIMNGDTITAGKFYSGRSHVENWTAIKDAKAALPDAYSLTYLKPGYKSISFIFPNLDSQAVSLDDQRFRDKVVIVQISGSWCPNCMDETAFLADFYNRYASQGLEIIGLFYERSPDFQRAKKNITRLKNRYNVPYTLLFAGTNKQTNETLPMLNKVLGFPTTLILDRKGEVKRIHTGFSGPGTGKHYEEFKIEFEEYINKLLAEK